MFEKPTRVSTRPIPAILESIVAVARQRVESLRRSGTVARNPLIDHGSPSRSLASALTNSAPAIIAEIKKASPSKSLFRADFDPMGLAVAYEKGGAAALSVVTEPHFFQGDGAWLSELRRRVDIPILRKDFIIDDIQVAESASLGADAILLIARILSGEQLRRLKAAADSYRLEVLFEIHDLDDLQKVKPLNPTMIGINARNLDDFTVDMQRFHALVSELPPRAIAIAESGLDSPAQILELSAAGFRGFLIGETLICSQDPTLMLKQLRGVA
jgi:indole-3-glycerol phosphate synthase